MAQKQSGRWRYIGAYTLAFAVVGLVVFSAFILNGRSLVWHTDGLTQHVKALSYYGMWLRGIVDSIAAGHPYAPTFAFSLGYGADVVDTLSYYVVGDPLNLFSVFVPEEATPILYSVLLVLRMYLAGLAFSLFVSYVFDPPRTGLLAGALTYVFCGFAVYAVVRHAYFANPLIYFPLVLFGVERVLRERKHGVFALAIALSAISNFYFFYMIFILMALYIIMRLVALHHAEGAAGAKAAFGKTKTAARGRRMLTIAFFVIMAIVISAVMEIFSSLSSEFSSGAHEPSGFAGQTGGYTVSDEDYAELWIEQQDYFREICENPDEAKNLVGTTVYDIGITDEMIYYLKSESRTSTSKDDCRIYETEIDEYDIDYYEYEDYAWLRFWSSGYEEVADIAFYYNDMVIQVVDVNNERVAELE